MANDNDCIKVLMVGARRCGKSTLLASLVSSAVVGMKDILTVKDVTSYASDEETLDDKVQALKTLFDKLKMGTEVTLDTGATNVKRDYMIEVTIPKYSGSTRIMFTDVKGEYFQGGNTNIEDMKKRTATYDIILVAIDTTFLMGNTIPGNNLCSSVINKAVNQIPSVDGVLKCLDDDSGQLPRQVIFCPIKAEKWIQEGKFDQVVERFKSVYDVTLRALSALKNVEILILPVQTVGGLSFTRHRKSQLLTTLTTEGQITVKCSPCDDNTNMVMLSEGVSYTLKPDDVVQPDPKSKLISIFVPYSWFKVGSNGYTPHGCDMLAYHVLRFTLARTLEAKKRSKSKKSLGYYLKWGLKGTVAFAISAGLGVAFLVYSYLKNKWGTLNMEALSQSLQKIKALTSDNDKTLFLKKSLITE